MNQENTIAYWRELATQMKEDMPIDQLEVLESAFKKSILELAEYFSDDLSLAFALAHVQKEMGLLRKYKSYGVKCCTPLGYSIFLLNQGEGFSFQNHLDFKVELFHVLSVLPGGYVFLCSADEWEKIYDQESFERWLAGEFVAAYDVFKQVPTPGGVIKIDRTGIVHTAIGCILEEYANVSTDMVQRLYDQNKGRSIPTRFTRQFVGERLGQIVFPQSATEEVVLHTSKEFSATRVVIDPGLTKMIVCNEDFVSIYFTEGTGELHLEGFASLSVSSGDPVLLVPHTTWVLKNTSDKPMSYSCLRVPKQHALK